MTDLAASNITYSFDPNDASVQPGNHGKKVYGTISFGNGTLTLPSGGLTLDKAKMGCPNRIFKLEVINSHGSKYARFEFDPATEKLKIFKVSTADLLSLEASPTALEAPIACVLDVEVIGY